MCVFCEIVSGNIPSHKIYEDEKTLAILDITPSAPGHTMVIPKEHCEDLMDLPVDMASSLLDSVQKVTKMLEVGLGRDNFTIGVNSGKIVGRHVEHLHVHIIPRFKGDGGEYIQGVVSVPLDEPLEEIKRKILEGNAKH